MIRTFLRHGSNAVLVALLVFLAVGFAASRASFSWFFAVVGALAFFTSEYTTHRFLFHAKPSSASWLRRLQHRLHYDHHIDPPKVELLFLPLWFVIPVALLYFGAFFAIVRDVATALSFAYGAIAALTYYEWVHFVAHAPFNPVTPFGRYVKKYHLWHHFKNEHLWYGVTNPSMDRIMGTYRDVDDAGRSGTVREIWRGMGS